MNESRHQRKTSAARRTPADGIHDDVYVMDESGKLVPCPPPSRRFTQQDRERVDQNRDRRHTRVWWLNRLPAIDEGDEIVTDTQYQAHITYGRSKGWLRPSSKR